MNIDYVAVYNKAPGRSADRTDTIAQGKAATASSTESAAFTPADAVDGNTTTRWSSAFSDPQSPGRPRLHPHHQRGEAELGGGVRQGVPDTDLQRRDQLDHRLQHDHRHGGNQTLNVSGSGRYVRMYGTQGHGVRVFALRVPGARQLTLPRIRWGAGLQVRPHARRPAPTGPYALTGVGPQTRGGALPAGVRPGWQLVSEGAGSGGPRGPAAPGAGRRRRSAAAGSGRCRPRRRRRGRRPGASAPPPGCRSAKASSAPVVKRYDSRTVSPLARGRSSSPARAGR